MAWRAVKVISKSMDFKKEAGLLMKEILSKMIFEVMSLLIKNLNYIFRREVKFIPNLSTHHITFS